MDFFRILNIAGTIVAWLLVFALGYAVYPYFHKMLIVVQTIHDFAR